MVSGAAVPAGEPCVRTELDHAERNDRAREGVPVSPCADERIDVAREISLSKNWYTKKHKQDRNPANSETSC